MKVSILLLGLGLALSACGSSNESATRSDDETVFDPLTETLDRAEEVQSTLDERAEALRRRVEESED